jgi:hypothetical protein
MSPGRTSGALWPLSGARGAESLGGLGKAESEVLGRSGPDVHDEIRRATPTRRRLSSVPSRI